MGVMGHLFIVSGVTRLAASELLLSVPVPGGLQMAGGAGKSDMGRTPVTLRIYQGNLFAGLFLRLRIRISVAIKAET